MIVILTIFFLIVYCVLELFSRDGKSSRKYKKLVFNPDVCLLKAICMIIVLVLLILNRFVFVDTIVLAESPATSLFAYGITIGMIILSLGERNKSKRFLEEMEEKESHEETDMEGNDADSI